MTNASGYECAYTSFEEGAYYGNWTISYGLRNGGPHQRMIEQQSNLPHSDRIIGGYKIGNLATRFIYASDRDNPDGAPSWMEITSSSIPAPLGNQSRAQVSRGFFPLAPPEFDGVDFTKIPVWNIH